MKVWTFSLYVLARWEVSLALLRKKLSSARAGEDILDAGGIPSAVLDRSTDRVLAEVDQDGFLFAVDPRDQPFFNRRETMVPRNYHGVRIVLTGGEVRLQKTLLYRGPGVLSRIREALQWEFYLEAAALLRLSGVKGVPAIRRIDRSMGLIEMEYIWGSDLRSIFAGDSPAVDYPMVSLKFAAAIADTDSRLSRELAQLLRNVMDYGVIPRDIQAGNFIRGRRSGALYIVDFNLTYLRPVPGWRAHARDIDAVFGIYHTDHSKNVTFRPIA